MPTYEYECLKCGYQFERFQKISEEPLKRCPKCKSKVRRLIGGGCGLIFKGSGFYITDYKRNKNSPETSGEKKKSGGSVSSEPKSKDNSGKNNLDR